MSHGRKAVVDAARRLFAERGYQQVTIRQIAAEAGVSPALVMKVGGSKADVYRLATPAAAEPLGSDWPRDCLGELLVRRVIERRDAGTSEPWLQWLMAAIDAPDPAAGRAEFVEVALPPLTRVIGGPAAQDRAVLLAAMLLGLAVSVRTMRLLDDPATSVWAVRHYGALAQAVIDG